MLIIYKKIIINLDNVNIIGVKDEKEMHFYTGSGSEDGHLRISFSSKEHRDLSLEKIVDHHRWQRPTCDLNEQEKLNENG